MEYSENALNVFKKLYFKKDEGGNLLEDNPDEVFKRVSVFISDDINDSMKWEKRFYDMMKDGYFRPNTPCLMNAGVQEKPQTAACFVGDMEDDLCSILDFDREAALVFASGSGIGINFGTLRERGAALSSGGESSGPFAFMKKLASTGEAVKSGGRSRRAAIMSMFFDDHPDLLEFITIKNGVDQDLRSMNLSVAASDAFMKAVKDGSSWELCGVIDGRIKSTHNARDIFDLIATNAHKSGDPGIWFIDRANADNGLNKQYGSITSTNPCGEQSLLPHGACALASINLAKFVVEDGKFDYEKFREIVTYGTYFLDFMIEKSGYPTKDYEDMAKNTRPLGLGIMGLADMLCLLEIPYDSQEAYILCGNIAEVLTQESIEASMKLAEDYGAFPAFNNNINGMTELCEKFGFHDDVLNIKPLRNSSWTTIAPTGTISISADCSPGMEPLFGITYTKNIADSDEKWIFVNPIFESLHHDKSWYKEAVERIELNHGSCQGIECVPLEVRRVWKTAHDIDWKDRIEMQAHLQTYISNAISSTINLPRSATVDEIKEMYLLAWQKGLKGITVYRDGSLDCQPVEFEKEKEKPQKKVEKLCKGRPKIRDGKTYEVATGHGNVFITVNHDCNGKIFEIFNAGGKGGGKNAAKLEAIGRLVSLALQYNVPIDEIASQLINIGDGSIAWDKLDPNDTKSTPILSIPDAIGKVLKKFYSNKNGMEVNMIVEQESIILEDTPVECAEPENKQLLCPECGGNAEMKEGCLFCPSCGSMCS